LTLFAGSPFQLRLWARVRPSSSLWHYWPWIWPLRPNRWSNRSCASYPQLPLALLRRLW